MALDLHEMIGLMAAPIYAARLAAHLAEGEPRLEFREEALLLSVSDARHLWWTIVGDRARAALEQK